MSDTRSVVEANLAAYSAMHERAIRALQQSLEPDTIGSAIDALNAGVAMVNAASERMQALGLRPHISVNGQDYGDKIAVRLDGDLVR